MVVTEEFSFPIFTNNNMVHNPTILPPLWSMRIISNSYVEHASSDQKNYEGTRKVFRRSFSEIESQIMISSTKFEADDHRVRDEIKTKEDEEKMDMLWEGLNEDLLVQGNGTMMRSSSSSSSCSPSSLVGSNGSDFESELHKYGSNSACKEDQYRIADDYQCNDLKFMPSGGGGGFVNPRKKNNLESVVKMMKKLFLIQDMPRRKKF